MNKENIEYKMRSINSEIWMAYKYIQSHLARSNGHFSFRKKTASSDNFDVFSAWQLEINTEMVFVKVYVFIEYLRKLNITNKYKVNQKLVSAGLRAYVTHDGTQRDFDLLSLPFDTLVITDKLELINDHIFFTLLSGDYMEKISTSKKHKLDLSKELFDPHFRFVKENYPTWEFE